MKTSLLLTLLFFVLNYNSLISQETEPNNSREDADIMQLNIVQTGHMSTADGEDWFLLDLPFGGTLRLDFFKNSDDAGRPIFRIIDGEADTYVEIVNMDLGSSRKQDSLFLNLLAGSYYILVDHRSGPAYEYEIHSVLEAPMWAEDVEMNDDTSSAQNLEHEGEVSGLLAYYNPGVGYDEEDYFRLELPQGGILRLDFSQSGGGRPRIKIYEGESGNLEQISSLGLNGNDLQDSIFLPLLAGTYFVHIQRFGGTAFNYRILTSLIHPQWLEDIEPNNNQQSATSISAGDTISGIMGYYQPAEGNDGFDWYSVDISERGLLSFNVEKTTGLRITVQLRDSTTIISSYGMRADVNQAIVQAILEPGTYFLAIDWIASYGAYNIASSLLPSPTAEFEYIQVNNNFIFNNTSVAGTSYHWDFGDDVTSSAVHPSHEYTEPGIFDCCLVATSPAGSDTTCHTITVEGISSIYPTGGGNIGDVTLTVYGGGFVDNSILKIQKDGIVILQDDTTALVKPDALEGRFDLREQDTGVYDIVVEVPGGSQFLLEDAFTIEPGTLPDPWVEISGRSRILFNTPTTYTVRYGNNGNVNANAVPIWLAFSDVPDLEIDFSEAVFIANAPDGDSLVVDENPEPELTFFTTDEIMGEAINARVYPLILPVIPANSTDEFKIKIQTPESIEIRSWANAPFFQSPVNKNVRKCFVVAMTQPFIDEIPTLSDTEVGCFLKGYGADVLDIVSPNLWDNFLQNYYLKFFESLSTASAPKAIISHIKSIHHSLKDCLNDNTLNSIDISQAVTNIFIRQAIITSTELKDCLAPTDPSPPHCNSARSAIPMLDCPTCGTFCPVNIKQDHIRAVSSLDPNEKGQPSGYGIENYINYQKSIPYTIHFENVDTADVPAHRVRVVDTLDAEKFDFSTFQFSSVSIADSTVYPDLGQKQMILDFELPNLNVVARIEGIFDEQSGVIQWLFRSLDPSTFEEIEDPDIGFLPPNVSKPEGQGSVSFTIDLKDDLTNGQAIKNKALIYFDANDPIETNTSLFTLDLGFPESHVMPLEAESNEQAINVSWEGTDNESGVRFYDIYVSENGDDFVPWRKRTTATSDTFYAENDGHYRFFSVAVDSVGLEESIPETWDAETTVSTSTEDIIPEISGIRIWPNPARDKLVVEITLEEQIYLNMNITDLLGHRIAEYRRGKIYPGKEHVEMGISDIPDGIYLLNFYVDDKVVRKKIVVMR